MEVLTDSTWHYNGMNQNAKRTRTHVLQKFWQDNISDKNGRRDNIPPNAQRKVGGVEIRGHTNLFTDHKNIRSTNTSQVQALRNNL